jgi:hypothetical protein
MDLEILNSKNLITMNKTHYILLLICSVFLLNSCEKDADVKLPSVESKLVINAFISPQDTMIKVTVSLSQPLFNNSNSTQYSSIDNATVQVSNGSSTQTLTYNSTDYYYFLNATQLPIIAGNTYYLTVTTPDGKNVNASTTIPSIDTTLSFSTHQSTNPNSGTQVYINASWNDIPGSEDYYQLAFYTSAMQIQDLDTSYIYYLAGSDNFSDKNVDGQTMNNSLEVYLYDVTSKGELELIHASKEYYLYHSKFAEPVIMYTNINGGYGVFAGFNQYKKTVVF